MTLTTFFEKTVNALKKENVQFALAGGMMASIYRKSPRATHDLDFVILSQGPTEKSATEILARLGLDPYVLRKADLEGGPLFAIKKKNTPAYMIAGRSQSPDKIGVDFVLPEMPWALSALTRAQNHQINFGFGPVPCITAEDLLISKFYALNNQKTRFMDLDDIKSIFESTIQLDVAYLAHQINEFKIEIPEPTVPFAPKLLLQLLK